MAHTLQLAVRDALKEASLEPLLEKVRALVVKFRRSNKLIASLRQQQKMYINYQENPAVVDIVADAVAVMEIDSVPAPEEYEEVEEILIEEGRVIVSEVMEESLQELRGQTEMSKLRVPNLKRVLIPIIDVETRWNSTFHMLERLLVIKTPLKTTIDFSEDIDLQNLALNADEWFAVEEIWKILYFPTDLTVRMQGECYPTRSRTLVDLKTLMIDLFVAENEAKMFITQGSCLSVRPLSVDIFLSFSKLTFYV